MSIFPFVVRESGDGEDGLHFPSGLAAGLDRIGRFVRHVRLLAQCGDLTRAPLQLIRFEMNRDFVQCDWIARSPDPWDAGLRSEIGKRHASVQALRDAIEVRSLIFKLLPDVDRADLHVYRELPGGQPELIISGQVQRLTGSLRHVLSIAMRAKLLGMSFTLDDGILRRKSSEQQGGVAA